MSKKSTRVGVRYDQVDAYGRVNPRLPLIDDLASFLPYHTELNVYKDGTEQLLPVNTSEPTTSPILADIRYPTGVWRNKQYFTYRKSPTEATGKARIKSIKGNTLVWNQLCDVANPNSQGTPYTYNSSNHSYTVTWEEGSSSTSYVRWTSIPIVSGHKYLVRAKILSATDGWQIRCLPPTSSTGTNLYPGTHADLFGKGEIFVGSADSNGTFSISKNSTFTTAQTVTFIPQVYDLSAMFGVGNEPTVDVFNALYYLDYYAYGQYLLNFNGTGIKTTGFNQWDEEWGNIGYNVNTGVSYTDNTRIGSVNKMPCFPNTIYYNKAPNKLIVLFYNGNNYLGYVGANANSTFTTNANATQFAFYVAATYGTTYNNDICVNISDANKNGTYEPYTTSTTSLPISTYFPTGMKSAGSGANTKYDEITGGKAITRIGTRAYASGDESDSTVTTDGTNTNYELATYTEESTLNLGE